MEFSTIQMIAIAFGILLAGVLVGRFMRKREGESLLAKMFQTNEDLDSTLKLILKGAITFAVLIIIIMFFSMFHDDLDKSDVGMLGAQIVAMGGLVLKEVVGNGSQDNK